MHRSKHKTIPNEPKNRKEIQIPEEYSKTIKENEFVLIDTKDAQRIIMFGTLDFFKKMCVTETLYGDGTFYSVPKLFYQLYTLHGFYKNEMIPFIYILLPDKKEQTYLRMFRLIQDKAIELNLTFSPKVFHLDFEKAVHQTVKSLFNCQIKGCLFHFCQAIFRKFNKIIGKNNYKNKEMQQLLRRTIAIPFLPKEDIEDAWDDVMETCDRNNEIIVRFLNYVTENWMDLDAKYNKEDWNHYRNFKTRTNNHLEGFHNGLNYKAGAAHKNFFQFVNLLKYEQEKFENKVLILNGGSSAKKQDAKYRKINNTIINLTNDYDNYTFASKLDFLDLISNCLTALK